MRIVIIGGLGLIGRAVSRAAKKKGHEVTLLTRRRELVGINHANIEIKHWDGADSQALCSLIDQTDAIINLAGESIGKGRWTEKRKRVLLESRLVPARALVKALQDCKQPPRTLVQASAIGIYGIGEDTKTEDSTAGSDYLARFALEWEASTSAVEEMGIRRVVIRTGIVLDKKQGVLPQLMLPFKLMAGGKVGSGRQILSWIHIEDEAGAILYLLEKATCKGVYNLTAPYPFSNSEFGKILAKVIRRPYWLPIPGFVLNMLLGEMSTLVLDGQRVVPKRLEEEGYAFMHPDLEETLIDLCQST